MFYLDYNSRTDVFADVPQTVTVRVGNQVLQSFVADTAGRRIRRIPLPPEALGPGYWVDMDITVDRTFVPATRLAGARDRRELGIQVYRAFVVLR